jgi:FkbM family methyltransferase
MLKKTLNRIRYNYFLSKVISYSMLPFYKIALWIARQVRTKGKLNGITIKYDTIEVKFPKDVGVGFSSSIFWKGDEGFEPHTWRVIRSLSKQADVFIDIGSNFGFYSVLVHKINPGIQSICFEPVAEIYQDNLKFHAHNNTLNYEVLNFAVSDAAGTDTIFLPKGTSIKEVRSASLEKDFFYNQQFDQHQLTITKIVWDEYVQQHADRFRGKKCLMKIDVEGHELSVFKGSMQFIRAHQPFIVCEIDKNAANINALTVILTELEYAAFAVSPVGLFAINFTEIVSYTGGRDFLLIPKSKTQKSYLSFQELNL